MLRRDNWGSLRAHLADPKPYPEHMHGRRIVCVQPPANMKRSCILKQSALGLAMSATIPACQVNMNNEPSTDTSSASASSNSGTTQGTQGSDSASSSADTTDTGAQTTGTETGDTQSSGNDTAGAGSTGTATSGGTTTTGDSSQEPGEPDTSSSDSTDSTGTDPEKDPYLWLEKVEGKEAMDWVKSQNERTKPRLEAVPGFEATKDAVATIVNSDERIPTIQKHGEFVYNYWKDATHIRGIWRRTTLESYRSDKTEWTTVLDLDKLATDEKENWIWHGATCLLPDAKRCMIALSRGGGDASVKREFDTTTNSFVKDGFVVPEAKSDVSWQDQDHLFVSSDFGEGSLTDSGYARTTRRWTRGTELKDAKELYAGETSDIAVYAFQSHTRGQKRNLVKRLVTFYTGELYRVNPGDSLSKYPVPDTASVGFWGPWIHIELKQDWTVEGKVYKQGTLLIIDEVAFLSGNHDFSVLYTPSENSSLVSVTGTKDHLLVAESRDVKGHLTEWTFNTSSRGWSSREVKLPGSGGISIQAYDSDESNDYFLSYQDHLTPNSLLLGTSGKDEREELRTTPEFFDASNMQVKQHFATSKDGTKIPYFEVSKKDIKLDGTNPTLIYGYGGFEVSLKPTYSGSVGKNWLEKGGVFVVANIRGGGEYGPAWHRAALKEKRQNAFDDFIAVGEDLVKRKVTSAKHLGIRGGSNGGLLTGAVLVQRPDLWGAVISSVPLLDMKRFHKLLAGASWMAEYGNPDLASDWEFLSKYSPYQNVKEGVDYPALFLTTSTKDDRVHPGHARKMLAKMLGQKHNAEKLFYYENIEGGHGGSANNEQIAYQEAMMYAFLGKHLGLKLD